MDFNLRQIICENLCDLWLNFFNLIMTTRTFRFSQKYFILSLLLFITEVLIALFVRDSFIRPYFGDFMVLMLLYCIVRSFWNFPVLHTVLVTLAFAYLVETLQYFRFVEHLGLQNSVVARTVIGTGFAWGDMVAYTLGGVAIWWGEKQVVNYSTQ
jgi:hypothetical protein